MAPAGPAIRSGAVRRGGIQHAGTFGRLGDYAPLSLRRPAPRPGPRNQRSEGPDPRRPAAHHVPCLGTEPFPSWLCLADLQYVDGLGEPPGFPGAAVEFPEDLPGLELGVRALAGRAEFRVRAVGVFL